MTSSDSHGAKDTDRELDSIRKIAQSLYSMLFLMQEGLIQPGDPKVREVTQSFEEYWVS